MKESYESATLWALKFNSSIEVIFLLTIASSFLVPNTFDHMLQVLGVVGLLLNVLYSDLATRYLGACCENKPVEETRVWKIALQVVQYALYVLLLVCGVLFLSGN